MTERAITGFHLDEEGHWVAELACGHGQHVRHRPPWEVRAWVTTEAGREGKLGVALECKRCDEPEGGGEDEVRDLGDPDDQGRAPGTSSV